MENSYFRHYGDKEHCSGYIPNHQRQQFEPQRYNGDYDFTRNEQKKFFIPENNRQNFRERIPQNYNGNRQYQPRNNRHYQKNNGNVVNFNSFNNRYAEHYVVPLIPNEVETITNQFDKKVKIGNEKKNGHMIKPVRKFHFVTKKGSSYLNDESKIKNLSFLGVPAILEVHYDIKYTQIYNFPNVKFNNLTELDAKINSINSDVHLNSIQFKIQYKEVDIVPTGFNKLFDMAITYLRGGIRTTETKKIKFLEKLNLYMKGQNLELVKIPNLKNLKILMKLKLDFKIKYFIIFFTKSIFVKIK